ncbi:MAG: M48 family metalloprotease [Gemmatimonadales bacterium]|nr:M48 family metalloprotease [Gemmatimonadales bacterium]
MVHRAADLFTQQEANRRKSSWLLLGFVFFFAWIGFGADIALYLMPAEAGVRHGVPWVGIVATALAAGLAWSAWRFGHRQVLWSTRAMELITPVTPEQQRLVNVVEEMAIAAGLPRPSIWIVPDEDPNAFATGPEPAQAAIAVTEGLLARLDRDELQAVVAHEFAHIARYDTRLMTLVAAMVGVIALMSDGMGRMLFHSQRATGALGRGMARRAGGRRLGQVGPALPLVLVLWLVSLLAAPVVSRLLSMAISRKREFLADATAAQYTRNPAALARALRALEDVRTPTLAVGRGAAALCIVDPSDRRFQRWKGAAGDLFASHPSIEERVRRLEQMGAR